MSPPKPQSGQRSSKKDHNHNHKAIADGSNGDRALSKSPRRKVARSLAPSKKGGPLPEGWHPAIPGEAEFRSRLDQSEYRLTFYRILHLILGSQWADGYFRNRVSKLPYLFRSLSTLDPITQRSSSTPTGSLLGPSDGSLRTWLTAARRFHEHGFDKRSLYYNAPALQTHPLSKASPHQLFLPIALWLECIEDVDGKGLIDPLDPEKREIRLSYGELYALWLRDIDLLGALPPEIEKEFRVLRGEINEEAEPDPMQELYDLVPNSPQVGILQNLLWLYRGKHQLISWEDVSDRMLDQYQLSEEVRRDRVWHLIDAIGEIEAGKLPQFESFATAFPTLAENLRDFQDQAFDGVEDLLVRAGVLPIDSNLTSNGSDR